MSRAPLAEALLLARTVRHLRPAQVAHRGRLRAQRLVLARFPGPLATLLRRPVPHRPGWPDQFAPLDARVGEGFPSPEANADGRFCFLNEERALGRPPDWEQAGASQLWRSHLHYFDWAWAFTAHPDRAWAAAAFRCLWRSWREDTTFGRSDAWSPYVASLRAWALCGTYSPLVAGRDDEPAFLDDLALHAGFVRANLELDVGGNHLVKNLKALIGLGVFLRDDALLELGARHLQRQVPLQVLADGGHFERSPSYHGQVLGDLVDVAGLLASAGLPPVGGLDQAVSAMQRWLGAMLMPDGDVPLFNDCTLVGHDRLKLLEPAPAPAEALTVLQPSGYVVMRAPGLHLVADVGPPCPDELPAHAHADCLGFELAVDGRRLIVDTGTSTYQPGPRRAHERSTAAHSTVEVDGADQTEVWSAFRAARRAEARLERAEVDGGDLVVTASHDGYVRLSGRPRHRRTWRLGDGRVEITDEVGGVGHHRAVARLILAPGLDVEALGGGRFGAGPSQIALHGGDVSMERAEVATGFGATEATSVLSVTSEGALPRRLTATVAGPPSIPRARAGTGAEQPDDGAGPLPRGGAG